MPFQAGRPIGSPRADFHHGQKHCASNITGRRYGCSLIDQSAVNFAGYAETGSGTSIERGDGEVFPLDGGVQIRGGVD